MCTPPQGALPFVTLSWLWALFRFDIITPPPLHTKFFRDLNKSCFYDRTPHNNKNNFIEEYQFLYIVLPIIK